MAKNVKTELLKIKSSDSKKNETALYKPFFYCTLYI